MASIAVSRAFSRAARRVQSSRKEFSTLLNALEEFPGTPETTPEQAKASTVSVTTLPSGVVVATEDAATSSSVLMTYPKAGSGVEMIGEHGAALINKCLAFKSGSGLSTVLINRTIENEGGTPYATANRTSATLGYTVEPDNAVGLVPLLATDCTFEKWDVRDAVKLAKLQTSEASKSAQIVLTEQIFAGAYGPQSPMGRPFYCADAVFDDIIAFRGRGYGINGAVLAATGVKDHQAFCTAVTELLSEAPAGTADPAPSATYLGGEGRVAAPSSGYAHVALAFEAKTSVPLGNVLKKCFDVVGKDSGVSAFKSGSLLGVYAGAPSEGVGAIDSALTDVMVTAPTDEIVERAKKLAKAEAMFELDAGSMSLAGAITESVLTGETFSSAADLAAKYDAISTKDVEDALGAVLKTNPTVAAVGDISVVPYQGTFASRFN